MLIRVSVLLWSYLMYDKVFFFFNFILDYVSNVLVSLRGGTGRGCHIAFP